MCASVDEVLRSGLDPRLRLILAEWRAAIAESRAEVARRIHRGATIVLATTAKSTREALDDWGRFPAFDWVVIEEAAKAWPTELAIPLTRGVRWTLIGDHKQLPAYRQEEFQRTLVDFAASDRPGAELVAQNLSEIREAFELFASVFARTDPAVGPIDTLRTQFRMRRAIADVVSSAFYPTGQVDSDDFPVGAVETHPSAEARRNDLTAPPALVDRPLVWVDTSGSTLIDEPAWRNPGEADLIARLVRALKPARTATNLVVLTPYLDQRRTVEERLIGVPVETVHGYQGKQADVVIASLVRTTSRGPFARSNIGFLADPQITNVLLSRAQTLLVLVGNLNHFEGCGDETWRLVTQLVRSRGVIVAHDAPTLGLDRS
jgi:superfamily I DNA and/or RNA helicase